MFSINDLIELKRLRIIFLEICYVKEKEKNKMKISKNNLIKKESVEIVYKDDIEEREKDDDKVQNSPFFKLTQLKKEVQTKK